MSKATLELANCTLEVDLEDPKPNRVKQFGTDTSGRPIYLSVHMACALIVALGPLKFHDRITLVQGAYMSRIVGGGADASSGYHDENGCVDFRTYDLDDTEQRHLVKALRQVSATWRRDMAHGGFDPHCHAAVFDCAGVASGVKDQWAQYAAGLDGLASRGSDYEHRPTPLVTSFDFDKAIRQLKADQPKPDPKPDPEPTPNPRPHQDETRKAINRGAQAAVAAGKDPTRWRRLRQAFLDIFKPKEKR